MSTEAAKKGPEVNATPEQMRSAMEMYGLTEEELADRMNAGAVAETNASDPTGRIDSAKDRIDNMILRDDERTHVNSIVEKHTVVDAQAIQDLEAERDAKIALAVGVTTSPKIIESRSKPANDEFEAKKAALTNEASKAGAELAINEVLSTLEAGRKIMEATYTTDVEEAFVEASATKYFKERADVLRAGGNGSEQDLRRAAELDKAKGAAGAEAVKQYKIDQQKRETANDKTYVKAVTEIGKLTNPVEGKLVPIKAENPEDTSQPVSDLLTSMNVDLSGEPLKAVQNGGRLRNNRTVDLFRESSDPTLKGVVFVEHIDVATGKVIHLDVMKSPKPVQNEKGYNRKMRKWEKGIDSQLKASRENYAYKSSEKRGKTFGADDKDGAFAAVLKKRGVSGGHFVGSEGKKKLKPKAGTGFWSSIFKF